MNEEQPIDKPFGGSGAAIAGALPVAFDTDFSVFFVDITLATLGVAEGGSTALASVVLDGPDGTLGLDSDGAGCIEVVLGELVALALDAAETGGNGEIPKGAVTGCEPGGGGSGAIPRLFFSLAAAAAAADAYFNPSPAGRVGNDAGFMELLVLLPFVTFDKGVCSVASVGNGDLSCVEGRRAAATAVSPTLRTDFAARLPVLESASAVSSCTDCVS